MKPTEIWVWDAETGEIVDDRIGGGPVDFTDEPKGMLAAAAPDMARALLEIRDALENATVDLEGTLDTCDRVLRKAGVLP